MKKILHSLVLATILLFIYAYIKPPAFASEGRFLLLNTRGGASRCLALSVEVETTQFQIIMTCRGLVYPPEPPDLKKYVVWAIGRETENPARIGTLTYGKGQGLVNSRFDRIFVTLEEDTDPRRPEGTTIMEGNIADFNFETVADTNPTPTPSDTNVDVGENQDSPDTDNQTDNQDSTDGSFWQSTFGKIIIIVTAGFIIFVVIVVIYTRRS